MVRQPMPIAEMKKRRGKKSVCHSGCSRKGVAKKSVPRDDWWSVDREIPAITMIMVVFSTTARSFCQPHFLKTVWLNSRARTTR